jgi:hypothetical protein
MEQGGLDKILLVLVSGEVEILRDEVRMAKARTPLPCAR